MDKRNRVLRIRPAALALASAATAAGAVLAGTSPAGAADLPQVTFSVTGATFNLSSGSSPFGFWVWCDAGPGSSYGDCSGSMYFYAIAPNTVPVSGDITQTGPGAYAMTVTAPASRAFPDGISCTLTNSPPVVNGPGNTVTAACSSPEGSGTADNAVVAVSATP